MKKWIIISAIVLCVVIAIQPLAYQNCLRLNPLEVESVELHFRTRRSNGGCIVIVEGHHIELTGEEIWKLSALYNLSSPIGTIEEEPPSLYDRIEITFKSGTAMILYTDSEEQFLLLPGYYKISGEWLHDYIQELMEKYVSSSDK